MPGDDTHWLLVDISNSFTKVALARPDRLLARRKLPTRSLDAESLRRAVRGWRFGRVILCSVVPERTRVIRALHGPQLLEVSHRIELGIGIDYPKPATIGADRLANAAAVAALHGTPAVVVDFGTAVTFDIVSGERGYIGGVIAPGLEVMTDYLYQRTALLPRIDLDEPVSAVGRSTREAMLAGAVIGYRGLVDHILREVKREIAPRGRLKVVATGGYAELIARRLPALRHVDPDLTLEGLRVIAGLNLPFEGRPAVRRQKEV